MTDTTRNDDDPSEPVPFASLRVGQRVEVACEIESGAWRARDLQTRGVKASDKIKGRFRPSRAESGGRVHLEECHGIEIVAEPKADDSALGALAHIQQATQMILALQECRSRAHQLVRSATSTSEHPTRASVAASARAVASSSASLGQILDHAYGHGNDRASVPIEAFRRHLDSLRDKRRELDDHVARLTTLATENPSSSPQYFEGTFDPFLAKAFVPSVHAYFRMGEEELGDRLRGLIDRTETTTRVALGASIIAVVVAVILGLLVWRSIQRPIQRLHDAAVKLGRGHLDTRVDVSSLDEIGVLAEAFNVMAADLAATTVSMTSLESVFDSMAAALIIFDADGRILNINRATGAMLGFEREELIGKTFDAICQFDTDDDVGLPLGEEIGGRIASVERMFAHKDGSVFPVSLSGAELRAANGPVQGHVCVAQDLSNQKRVEATIRESLAEKELLLHELHHRVKNNMQVISSLLAMQTDDGNPEVTRRLEDSQNRIRTIALIHELLYRSPELAQIDIRSYLEVLAEHLLQSYGASESIRLVVDVADVELDLDQSLAVGLIVNELTTNSLKHAFPAEAEGTIRIELATDARGMHTLQVSDDGRGADAGSAGDRVTLGASLVTTLARQLRGRVEIRDDQGTTTRIVFGEDQNSEALAS